MALAGLNEINKILITKVSGGKVIVLGIKAPHISAQTAYVQDSINLQGKVNIAQGFLGSSSLPDGNENEPSLAFKSNPTIGICKNYNGISIVSGGASLMDVNNSGVSFHVPINFDNLKVNQISTTTGDLIINPAGANIDFQGKNLINVGSVTSNVNYYTISQTNIVTVNNSPTIIFSIPVNNNSTGAINYDIINGDNANNTGNYTGNVRYKNISGVVGISLSYNTGKFVDPLLDNTFIAIGVVTNNIVFYANGLLNTNIKWSGIANVNTQTI